jgi:hypothetical protein
MPSLMRFLTVLAALAAAVFATLYSLATFVTPQTREMTVTIPSQRLKPPSATAAARNPQTAGAEAAAESPQTR